MKLTFKAFPGKLFKEFLDSFREQGNKFPIGESLLFLDNKESGGWEIKEDIMLKAGTKVHIQIWGGQTNNEKKSTVCNIEIIPFEQAWTDAKTRDNAKPKDNANSSFNNTSDSEDIPF